ncbi:uncharacterized protein [Euwallacea fornicatus]|uniref:uncharacterized protein n=1 Tax=Euwallacea fornicatus TaxID=995702 RepID=UPI00338D544B
MTRPMCIGRESVKSLFPIYAFTSWLGLLPTYDLKQEQVAVWPLKIFCAFFLNLQKVETNKLMIAKSEAPRFWRRPVPQFILFNLLTIGGLAAIACLEPFYEPAFYCARIAKLILNYIEAVAVVLTANFIFVICHKYNQINRNLYASTLANTNALGRTRSIKQLYIVMDNVIEQFNQLSGKHILFVSAVVTCRLLTSLVSIAEALLETENTSRHTYMSNLVLILVALFELTSVTYSSQVTVAESQKLIPLCYDIQEKYLVYSDEYRALDNLIRLAAHRKVRFSAANLFDIDMSTLFTLLSGAISYLVVVLQSKNTI